MLSFSDIATYNSEAESKQRLTFIFIDNPAIKYNNQNLNHNQKVQIFIC